MSDLNKKYQKVLDELAQRIKDPNELDFVKAKVSELCIDYMASIDKILEIEKKQEKLESKVRKIEHELSIIEEDIYINDDIEDGCFIGDKMHDNDYEFEITCPYCGYEFLTDESCKGDTEIECPKCHNIIELDWKDECSGDCSSCGSHCSSNENSEEESDNGSIAVKEDESSNDQAQNQKNSSDNSSKQNVKRNKQDINYLDNNINKILRENNNEDDM